MIRLAMLTTGLRPAAHAFAALPGHSVGIVRWDDERAIARGHTFREYPPARVAIARIRRRPYASLAHLATGGSLRYVEIAKGDEETLRETLARWRIDLVITSGCPLVPMSALENVAFGGINLHPSLLPRYRGADPLFWQVADGVPEIGATVHRLAAGSDTGAVLRVRAMPRPPCASRTALIDALEGSLGVPLLERTIADIERGVCQPIEQPERSPTRYARALARHKIATAVPLASLDMMRCRDLVCYLGECPPGWLALEGWRRQVRWKPWRLVDAASDDSKWRTVHRGALTGLRRERRVLWFRPIPRRS